MDQTSTANHATNIARAQTTDGKGERRQILNDHQKKRCSICDTELDEGEDVCPSCGTYVEEPSYDQIADEKDEEH